MAEQTAEIRVAAGRQDQWPASATLTGTTSARRLAPTVPPFRDGRSRSSLLRHVLDGLVLLHGLFPIGPVELLDDHTPHSALIQAMGSDSWRRGHRERSRV